MDNGTSPEAGCFDGATSIYYNQLVARAGRDFAITTAAGEYDMAEAVSAILKAVTGLIQIALLLTVLIFIWTHWTFFARWFAKITHFEFYGLKFDKVAAEEKIYKLDRDRVTPHFARAALVRAERVLPALNGAHVLWHDQNPGNNIYERGILEDLGIRVQLALSTESALELIDQQKNMYDVIISSVMFYHDKDTHNRPIEYNKPLRCCRVFFNDFPNKCIRQKYNGDLEKFNSDANLKPPAGYYLADQLAITYPNIFGNIQRSRIVFYTGSAAGNVMARCARAITNQADVLLHTVISVLEEVRWERLEESQEPSAKARPDVPPAAE